MPVNQYFQAGLSIGRPSEQLLIEDLTIEALKIYGFDTAYIPRAMVAEDQILNEDALNQYNQAFPLEMYIQNVNGFDGDGDLLTKFGVEIRDSVTFIVSRRRWDQSAGNPDNIYRAERPNEGDIIYFPLTKAYFEIRRVEARDPFYQVGKLYVYKMECELMQYSSEQFETGDTEIDKAPAAKSFDMNVFQLLNEGGDQILLEYEALSGIILESYNLSEIDPSAQNEIFREEVGVLDFSESDPFAERLV